MKPNKKICKTCSHLMRVLRPTYPPQAYFCIWFQQYIKDLEVRISKCTKEYAERDHAPIIIKK